VIKVGLSYFDPEESIEDQADFDIPLDYCVTPNRLYEFD
jgi:5-formyltetrahydrofolate cyclo-ligase